jgi:hypothetical protein
VAAFFQSIRATSCIGKTRQSEWAEKVHPEMVFLLFVVAAAVVIFWFVLTCHGSLPMRDVTGSLASVSLPTSFPIFVKKPDGACLPMTVGSSDRVEDLKYKIQQREGVPVDRQVLLFDGSTLSDGDFLHEYSINVNSAVHLYYRRCE